MHFKRFLEINVKENNHFIVFKDNKIIYEPDLKTFLLESNYLDIDTKNALFIGIAESEKKIYGVDISGQDSDINIGYESLIELDVRPVSYTHLRAHETQ